MIGTAYNIGTQLGLPSIGGIIGGIFGNSRSEKRSARKQYMDALISMGVRPSLVQNWHSDEHSAGAQLLQIAQQTKGVRFLNSYMPSKITRSAVSSMPSQYQQWIATQNLSNTSVPPKNESSSPFMPLLGLGGLVYWLLK